MKFVLPVNCKLELTKSFANDWTTKTFAICLYGDWAPGCYSCWPSTTLEGVQGRLRHSVLQGIWWNRSLDSWMFLGRILWSQSLHLLISREALNPFTVTSDPHDWQKPFVKWVFHCIELPLHQNLIYWLSPLPLCSSLSELSEVLPPRLQSSFCPKQNLICNSQVVHLFLVNRNNH